MKAIEVTPTSGEGTRFSVVVRDDDDSATTHDVTVPGPDWERFGRAFDTREQLVEASFRFLLEREPKESILRSFELGAIERYFPDYAATIAGDRD
jgi:hypothetical protein